MNIAALEHPEVKKALTRSSTTSSIEDWLGLEKSKQDLRMSDLADSHKPASRRQSFDLQGKLPRISTFRTEKEHRALNKAAAASNAATINDTISEVSTPATGTGMPPGLSAKAQRPGFLRSISKRSLRSQPTTPSGQSEHVKDPMSESFASLPEEKVGPRSPKSPKGNGGLLWQPKRKSQEEKGPVLAKSRRTGTFDEVTAPPSQAPARPVGVPEFKLPDHHPVRPSHIRAHSSQISPRDDSQHGLNYHLLEFFEEACEESNGAKEMSLRPPPQRTRRNRAATAAKSRNYLPTEAKRINTPPVVKPGKGNRLAGHFWDHGVPGVESGSATTNSQHVHTPFPMPAGPSSFGGGGRGTASAPTTPIHIHTRGEDWYRVRADEILDEDERYDSIEELKAMFDWDVPDHLPTSPLCPAHPKHPSGGTGICVYHGRGKKKPVDLLISKELKEL